MASAFVGRNACIALANSPRRFCEPSPFVSLRVQKIAILERVKGIEPSFSAWEADVLPLNYTRRMPVTLTFYDLKVCRVTVAWWGNGGTVECGRVIEVAQFTISEHPISSMPDRSESYESFP